MAKIWLVTLGLVALTAAAAMGAVAAPIYKQNYVVEATITPLANPEEAIKVSEVWSTVVYRDLSRFHTVVRVFGEALHFEFAGEDYFALKRGANNGSAGAFDLLRECLGIEYLADYESAAQLATGCQVTERTPMIVKVDAAGLIERLSRERSSDPYSQFDVEVSVKPTDRWPSYELMERFPWIGEMQEYEPSVLPTKIPEEGAFVDAKHYQKDFVVHQ